VLKQVTLLRRVMVSLSPVQGMETLIKKLSTFPSNAEFLAKINTSFR
jgi:transcription termination factor Rho